MMLSIHELLEKIHKQTITEIKLEAKQYTAQDVSHILEALKSNTSVQKLSFNKVPLKRYHLVKLAHVVAVNFHIEHIVLDLSQSDIHSIEDLNKEIKNNNFIQSIDVKSNHIPSNQIIQLQQYLTRNHQFSNSRKSLLAAMQIGQIPSFELIPVDALPQIIIMDAIGNTLLHFAITFAAKFNEKSLEKLILTLLAQGCALNTANKIGLTPLHLAAERGQPALVKLLIKLGANISVRDAQQETIFHKAVRGKTIEVIASTAEWIDKETYFQLLKERNTQGQAPIHLAVILDDTRIISYLMTQSIDINVIDQLGQTPLHYAVTQNNKIVVTQLIDANADIEIKDNQGFTALALATQQKRVELEQLLMIERAKRSQKIRLNILPKDKSPFNRIKNLVFQGGGIKGLAYYGALEALLQVEPALLQMIERIGGTSAGAISTLLLGLGYSVAELKEILETTNFENFKDKEGLALFKKAESLVPVLTQFSSISSFLWGLYQHRHELEDVYKYLNKELGFFSGQAFYQWLCHLIVQKTDDATITFLELHERRKHDPKLKDIYVIGTNLTTRESTIFSYEHTPDVVIADAIRISMSIPLFFKPHSIFIKDKHTHQRIKDPQGHLYCDGGLLINYPLRLFDKIKYLSETRHDKLYGDEDYYAYNHETFGLRIVPTQRKLVYEHNLPQEELSIEGLKDFVISIISAYMDHEENWHFHSDDKRRSIYVDNLGISLIKFGLTDIEKLSLIEAGTDGVAKYLKRVAEEVSVPILSQKTLAILLKYGKHYHATLNQRGLTLHNLEFSIRQPKTIYKLYRQADDTEITHLLKIGIDVNLIDGQGQTALFYAVSDGNLRGIRQLIAVGAYLAVKDKNDNSVLDIALQHSQDEIAYRLLKAGLYSCRSSDILDNFLHRLQQTKKLDVILEIQANVRRYRQHLPLTKPISKDIKSIFNSLWHIPKLTSYFEDREAELVDLENRLTSQKPVVIVGFGGIGKTQLAIAYADQAAKQSIYSSIVWLNANRRLTLRQELQHFIMQYLELNTEPFKNLPDHEFFLTVYKMLNVYGPVLFIFDDVQEETRDLLPNQQHEKLQYIATSRDVNWDTSVSCVELKAWPRSFASNYILRLLSNETPLQAQALCEMLEDLPTALAQAVAYIEQSSITIANYLEQYQAIQEKATHIKHETRLQQIVYQTLSLTLTNISLAAKQIMHLAAYFDSHQLPKSLLSWLTDNDKSLDETVNQLKTYAIVDIHEDKQSIEIHSLTQKNIQRMHTPKARNDYLYHILSVLVNRFTKDTRDKRDFDINLTLLPHIEVLLTYVKSIDDIAIKIMVAKILDVKAYFCSQIGMAQHSIPAFEQAKTTCEELAGIVMPKTSEQLSLEQLTKESMQLYTGLKKYQGLPELYVSICYSFGRTYFYTKDGKEKLGCLQALQLASLMCKAYEKDSGKRFYHQFLVEANGLLYLKLKKGNKTSEDYEKDLLNAKQHYGALLFDERPYYEKEKERYISRQHRKVIKDYKDLPMDDQKEFNNELYNEMICHLQLARTCQKLAGLLHNKGEKCQNYFHEALEHIQLTLQLAKQQLGNNRQLERLADYYNAYAKILVDDNNPTSDIKLAIQQFRKALNLEQAKNGGQGKYDFPLADAHAGLAKAYLKQGNAIDLMKSQAHSEKYIVICQAIYPASHPDIANARKLHQSIIERIVKVTQLPWNKDETLSETQKEKRIIGPYIIQRNWRFFKNKQKRTGQFASSEDLKQETTPKPKQ